MISFSRKTQIINNLNNNIMKRFKSIKELDEYMQSCKGLDWDIDK